MIFVLTLRCRNGELYLEVRESTLGDKAIGIDYQLVPSRYIHLSWYVPHIYIKVDLPDVSLPRLYKEGQPQVGAPHAGP